ncbi:MAG: UDP-N-acetylglucosamine 1-carboxyvinyltransferase [Armatimonadota bacterium]|nr:UDP-N-acetylglucosamine 1-carboxyvinyltransferase [Armatimonadota bacterium]
MSGDRPVHKTDEERIVVLGGVPLQGVVELSGSKNASLPILAASLLASQGTCVIRNVPHIADVEVMCHMLQSLGATVEVEGHTVTVDAEHLTSHRAPAELVRQMRASFYVAAPLLARLHQADVPLPGGCVLGARPVNYHIDAFKKMGAQIEVEHGAMNAKVRHWHGADIYLEPKNSSVGATVNIMMAACLAEGTTTIENAAREPEVVNLQEFLNKMGGQISGAGTATITIEGVKELHGTEHSIVNDRIEAGTYLAAAGITGGDVTVQGLPHTHLPIYLDKLSAAGLEITHGPGWVRAVGTGHLRATDITTAPFPGFATDLQPPFLAMMCVAEGKSAIEENLYDGRFNYLPELIRMGAEITLLNNTAIVQGVPKLSGAEVQSTDLRAGAALVLAGLAADGRSEITKIEYIDRGYENFVLKLRSLGGQVIRQNVPNISAKTRGPQVEPQARRQAS